MHELTQLLQASASGDRNVGKQLMQALYQQLKALARQVRSREANRHTLSTTALVHELYLDVCKSSLPSFSDRASFFRYAAAAMRHLLVDHARHHLAQKRGGGIRPEALADDDDLVGPSDALKLIAVDEALTQLQAHDEKAGQVLSLKFFAGMAEPEIAELMSVDVRTVRRYWQKARAFVALRLDVGSS